MHLTMPVTTATSGRTFSALRRLKNYLARREAGPPEQVPTIHCHKSITDTLDTVKMAYANEQRRGHFGKYE